MTTAQQRLAGLYRITDAVHRREEASAFDPDCLGDPVLATLVEEPALPPALPPAPPPIPTDEEPPAMGVLGLVEMILKRRDRLERLIRDPAAQAILLPRFLAIAVAGFVSFGVALSLVFMAAGEWPRLGSIDGFMAGGAGIASFEAISPDESLLNRWLDGSALIAAYAIGLVAATGICLPSLYFYGLLSGVRMTMPDVVIQALKAKATSAVALVGVLPIYAALGLGLVIFDVPEYLRMATFWLGLILPFIAGLFGTRSLYRGLAGFNDTLAPDCRNRRTCFLRRLVFSWAACYTAITPVMIHTLWFALANGI